MSLGGSATRLNGGIENGQNLDPQRPHRHRGGRLHRGHPGRRWPHRDHRQEPRGGRCRGARRRRSAGAAWWRGRAHAPGLGVRTDLHGGHVRHRHQVGRVRRHHHPHRLLQPDRGAESAEGPGGLAQAPRERLRRRRRAHDHARREPAQPGRHEDADRQGGRDQLQAVHGLSRRADGRRRCAVQGHARRRQQRCDDLHPRRERAGDPGAGAGGGGAGPACAQVSRDDPSVDS